MSERSPSGLNSRAKSLPSSGCPREYWGGTSAELVGRSTVDDEGFAVDVTREVTC